MKNKKMRNGKGGSRFYSMPSSVESDSGAVVSMDLAGGRSIDKNLYRAPSR